MSSSITTGRILSTTTTSYAWTGTANNSPSVERINGTEVRRNDALDPLFTTASQWYRQPKGTSDFSTYLGAVMIAADSDWSAGDLLTYPSANLTASEGEIKVSRYRISNYGQTTVEVYGNNRAYGASAIDNADGPTSPGKTLAPGEMTELVLPVLTVPADATGYRPLLRVRRMPAGSMLLVDQPTFQSIDGDYPPGDYFDGTAATNVVHEYETSTPILVDGYQSTRQSAHVVNPVIGSIWPDVALYPAGPRTGTLTLLYASEAEAVEAERMHAGATVLAFADTDVPTAAMRYVLDANLSRQLDPESRALWLVTVDFQEVQ